MTSQNIDTFLDTFLANFNAPKSAYVQQLMCLQKKINHFKSVTVKQWNSHVLIDKYDFSKISAHLIAFINKCFEVKANESLFHQPMDELNQIDEKNIWILVCEKLPNISKESIQKFFKFEL